jgi:hypothetical protein
VYGLDDAYIHLQIARNLAENGVFGLDEPGGTSSSPLWTLLLAGLFRVFGVYTEIPLLLNGLLALYLLYRLDAFFESGRGIWSLFLALVIPVPLLVFQGMEHLLQLVLALELLYRGSRERVGVLALLSLLLVGVRYEGLFLVAGLVWVLKSNSRAALLVGTAGILPVLAYGLYLNRVGWPFWPAGLIVKTAVGQPSVGAQILAGIFHAAENSSYLGALSFGLVLAAGRWPNLSQQARERVGLAVGAVIGHTLLAGFGHALRYEAWLYALIGAALGPELKWPKNLLSFGVAGLAGLLVGQRLVLGGVWVQAGATDIFRQQVQMARLVREYFPGEVVVVNDIGAITFLGGAKVVDIAGLGTREVLALRNPKLNRALELGKLAESKGASIAMVYPAWLGEVPEGWIPVGRLITPEPVILGGDTVQFYALSEQSKVQLKAALLQWAATLPASVSIRVP